MAAAPHLRRAVILGCLAWGLAVSLCGADGTPPASSGQPSEAQLKAAILLNFPKYVDWPATTFSGSNSPVIVAVCDAEEVARELRALLSARTPAGRSVEVRSGGMETVAGATCHVVYLGGGSRRRNAEVLQKLRGTHVVTVSEQDDFFADGGMIHLARQDRKFRLEVNLPAVEQGDLKLSSKLLSVANVVRGKPR